VKTSIPNCDNEFSSWHGQRTCEVNGVPASKRMALSKHPSVTFYFWSKFDRPCCRPELLPNLKRSFKAFRVKRVVALGCSERGPHFRVSEPTRYGGVATVPYLCGQIRAVFFDEELHKRA
jgi:hypothetical protein